MPATHDRAAQSMTGLWVGRGVYDGEGYTLCVLPKWLEDARAS
jgi:hypothetical protein